MSRSARPRLLALALAALAALGVALAVRRPPPPPAPGAPADLEAGRDVGSADARDGRHRDPSADDALDDAAASASDAARQAAAPDAAAAPTTFAIFGIVRGEDGQPRAGIELCASPQAVAENFLRAGRFGREAVDPRRRTTTDADGRYHLDAVPAGAVHLYALVRDGRRGLSADPWAERELRGDAGASLECDLQLDSHPRIGGSLRDRNGVPIAGAMVTAVASGRRLRAATDEQGRFVFARLQNEPHELTATAKALRKAPPCGQRDVWPDQGDVALVADCDASGAAAPCSVRGTVVDAGHRLRAPMSVSWLVDNAQVHTRSRIDGSAFAFEDVAPGRGRAIVYSGTDPVAASAEFVLAPGQSLDIGSVVTEAGGTLLLRVERPADRADRSVDAYLAPIGTTMGRTLHLGDKQQLAIDNLSPGEHRLSAWGDGLAHVDTTVAIAAGRTTEATIAPRAAVRRKIVVEHAEQAPPHVVLRDAAGHGYLDATPSGRPPYRIQVALPLGQFTLRAEPPGGAAVQVEFAVTTLDADQPEVRLVVR